MDNERINFLTYVLRILLAVALVKFGHPYWAITVAFCNLRWEDRIA